VAMASTCRAEPFLTADFFVDAQIFLWVEGPFLSTIIEYINMQKNILTFLKGLPNGRLELAYENLTFKSETIATDSTTLVEKEDMVFRLSTFPEKDVLIALLKTENQHSYSVESTLMKVYRRYACIIDGEAHGTEESIQNKELLELLQRHNSYAHQMELLERFAINSAWLEEPLERIIGVFAGDAVQFLIDTNQTQDSPGSIIEVRASKPVPISALARFARLASNHYPDEFQTEYCRNIYNSNHYEHPVQMIFSSFIEASGWSDENDMDVSSRKQWDDAVHNMCADDVSMRIDGRDKLVELIMVTPSLQQSLSHLIQNKIMGATASYPIFERELCSSKSLFSALWLFAYFDISLETVDTWDERTYEALMASVRELFNPIFDCVYESIAQSAT